MKTYIFRRAEGWYPLDLENDEAAISNAISNPGTLLVSSTFERDAPLWDSASHFTALVKRAAEALRLLHDYQNGCPLEKYRKEWEKAMRLSEAVLPELEAVK